MGDFFQGWRLKMGCVTLMVALIFLGGWLKSLRSFDEINCPLGKNYALAMTSWNDALAIRIGREESPWTDFYWMERGKDYYGFTAKNVGATGGSFVPPVSSTRIAGKNEEHWRAKTHASGTQPHI